MARFVFDTDLRIPARDGVHLAADLFRPNRRAAFPTIVLRTPYDRRSPISRGLQVDAVRMAESGYAVVLQDVRGRGGSEGSFFPFTSEATDGFDTISWVNEQPWCDGSLGLAGSSYLALCQVLAAAVDPPGLKAWVPTLSPFDVETNWIRENGAFNLGFNLSWLLGSIGPDPKSALDPRALARTLDDWKQTARWGKDHPVLAGSTLREVLGRWWRGEPVQLMEPEALTGQVAPALVIGGWFDLFQPGTFDLYRSLASGTGEHALIAGPWDHSGLPFKPRAGDRYFGASAGLSLFDVQRSWFDMHLRGSDENQNRTGVRYFVTGENHWEEAPRWPVANRIETWYPEHGGGLARGSSGRWSSEVVRLSKSNPTPALGGRLYPWEPVLRPGQVDQRPRQQRSDVLVYTSDPFTEPYRVLGPVSCDVDLMTSVPGSDVVVTLTDVDREGGSWNVADGVFRWFGPKGEASVSVPMGHVAHAFQPGHRLRVDVSFAAFPRIDFFPENGGSRELKLGTEATRLHVPVVP